MVAANDSKPTRSSDNDLERDPPGPDPVLGVGLVILGVFIMGVAGAATAHYIFNLGIRVVIVAS